MAVDASLLYTLPKGIATFRHYGWTEPAITFGYTQCSAEVQAAFPDDLRLCRRLTGGGIVDHRNDWTYALAIQSDLEAAHTPATEFYAILHTCIQQAFEAQQVPNQLAACPRACEQSPSAKTTGPDRCFTQATANDVLRPDGVKIAGAALKRTREGLLVQGSIDRAALPDDFNFGNFAESFQQALARDLSIPIGIAEDLRTLFDGTRIQEERTRFNDDAWTHRR
jgi:lipoate-protein ligase A